ncbi:IS3 family transposase [Candidatus Contubernalis alkalaceticus]|nr:IS3 family transposase [Candidatus Contubernalis alkalaceticus]UNC91147.1 IS3 family transposase [Candidatus Contubernalis alkalaceticus]UNC92064.1 IS3 family transposase [Candidatus Contubernalis alkalaceticus]UNC92634.1 IS3 family transposase [Candidatus Contubernalis alkalaceticus]UNC93505.1 IS3 family transposase [Candidatus Contubernalis alkalaceticus]
MPKNQYSPEEKLKIVLEALKEERLVTDIASDYDIHPSVIHRWKKELLENPDRVFAASKNAKAAAKEKQQQEEEIENLYSQVGRLTTQLEWLKKNLKELYPVRDRAAMVDWDNSDPNIKEQAELLSLNRTGLYRKVKEPSELEVKIKHLIDRIHTKHPFKGTRRIRDDINDMKLGFKVNRKRIQRYMRDMGIKVICPGPNLSKRNRAQYVYPYLLRSVTPAHPNHVWGIDITYCAMQGRWMYLVIIIDWYSRKIVGHELSQTMNKEFVIKAVNKAVNNHGAPIILNSDQGSQFTSSTYVDTLKQHGIKISMDGKGRALDNAITERFFRTIKWEDIYIKQYETPKALRQGIDDFIRYYNYERGHQSLNKCKPADIYYAHSYWQQKQIA